MTLVFPVQSELLPDLTVSMEDNPEVVVSLSLLCVSQFLQGLVLFNVPFLASENRSLPVFTSDLSASNTT